MSEDYTTTTTTTTTIIIIIITITEKMALTMHCNLKAARRRASLSRL